MTARHWVHTAALISAIGLGSTALAHEPDRPASAEEQDSVSAATEAPSAGAIVTPEDRALRMGKVDARAGDRNDDVDSGTPTSEHRTSSVDPGPSPDASANDDTSSADPDRR